ncbi:uncharacterized protein [Drosophila pseudoobscura]|uniref:Uncharacterized protein n=1 Tax=Drosophila pseudoobscura pseudoobscura TaxID=46245 RepID=A0A0R3P3R2_DROPS|nr:uncharacterized protein LOC26532281 [Drosophila pseudoobscura]
MCKCCRDCQLSVAMKKFAIWNVIFGLLSMDWSYRLMTTSGDYFFTAGCVHMSGAVLLIISGILIRVGIFKKKKAVYCVGLCLSNVGPCIMSYLIFPIVIQVVLLIQGMGLYKKWNEEIVEC